MYDLEACHEELQDVEDERDVWKARAEAAEGELRELRENVLIGLGMAAEDVAEMDGDLMEPSISFLLRGCQETFYELAALRAQLGWRPAPAQEWPHPPRPQPTGGRGAGRW